MAIFSAGNTLKWVRDKLFCDLLAAEKNGGEPSYRSIDRLASESPVGANKLIFVPTLAGGSSIDKSPDAKGCFFGLDLMHTRSDIARATLEGIALNLGVILDVLKKYVSVGDEMLLVGGGANSEVWRQIFADVYGMHIAAARVGQDAGSFGAAVLAAIGAGVWSDYGMVRRLVKNEKLTAPDTASAKRYKALLPAYKKLLDISSDVGDILGSLGDDGV